MDDPPALMQEMQTIVPPDQLVLTEKELDEEITR